MSAVVAYHPKKNKSPTCGPPVIALYSKKIVCVFVRLNLNFDKATRKMSAVVADHTSDDSYIYQLSLV